MQPYEFLILEALDCCTPKSRYERILELLEKERQLSKMEGYANLVQSVKETIAQTHPEIAVFIPDNIQKD